MSLMRVGGFLSYCNRSAPQPASWVTACSWNTRKQNSLWKYAVISGSLGRSWPVTNQLDQSSFKSCCAVFVCSWASFTLDGLQHYLSLAFPVCFRASCQSVISSVWKQLLGWKPLSLPLQMLLPVPIFQSHWVYSSPLKEEKMLKLCRVFMAPLCEQTSGILLAPFAVSVQQLQSCLLLRLYLDAESEGDSREPNSVLCQSANSVFSLSPQVHGLQRQSPDWKSAPLYTKGALGFFRDLEFAVHPAPETGLWKRGKMKVLGHLVLGSAVQTSNNAFTSADQVPFQHGS